MIKNSELYSFQEKEAEQVLETLTDPGESAGEPLNPGPARWVYQTIIAFLSLILVLATCGIGQSWSNWLRSKIHYAVNAPTTATFGKLTEYPLLHSLIQNTQKWIRLERALPATAPFETAPASTGGLGKLNPVWPVQGNVVTSYGWNTNPQTHLREFSHGITIHGPAEAEVYAMADGTIEQVTNHGNSGWSITINHGDGWKSIYSGLATVWVSTGQTVQTGATVAQLKKDNPALKLELYQQEQPVDPLSILKTRE